MNILDDVYIKLDASISENRPDLLMEFRKKWESESPREVFFWLQKISNSSGLPASVEQSLTDLYYSLR